MFQLVKAFPTKPRVMLLRTWTGRVFYFFGEDESDTEAWVEQVKVSAPVRTQAHPVAPRTPPTPPTSQPQSLRYPSPPRAAVPSLPKNDLGPFAPVQRGSAASATAIPRAKDGPDDGGGTGKGKSSSSSKPRIRLLPRSASSRQVLQHTPRSPLSSASSSPSLSPRSVGRRPKSAKLAGDWSRSLRAGETTGPFFVRANPAHLAMLWFRLHDLDTTILPQPPVDSGIEPQASDEAVDEVVDETVDEVVDETVDEAVEAVAVGPEPAAEPLDRNPTPPLLRADDVKEDDVPPHLRQAWLELQARAASARGSSPNGSQRRVSLGVQTAANGAEVAGGGVGGVTERRSKDEEQETGRAREDVTDERDSEAAWEARLARETEAVRSSEEKKWRDMVERTRVELEMLAESVLAERDETWGCAVHTGLRAMQQKTKSSTAATNKTNGAPRAGGPAPSSSPSEEEEDGPPLRGIYAEAEALIRQEIHRNPRPALLTVQRKTKGPQGRHVRRASAVQEHRAAWEARIRKPAAHRKTQSAMPSMDAVAKAAERDW